MTASSLLACLRVLGHRKVEQIPQRKRQKLRLNLGRSTPQPALLAFTELPLALFSAQEIEYLYCKTHRGGWLTSHRLALRTTGKLRQQTSNFYIDAGCTPDDFELVSGLKEHLGVQVLVSGDSV